MNANLFTLTIDQRKLVDAGMPLVEKCAADVARCSRGRITKAELLGPGTIALYEAARDYRQTKHPCFPQYAQFHVRGRILDAAGIGKPTLSARVEHAMERSFSRVMSHLVLDVDLFRDTDEELREGGERGCDDALAASYIAGLHDAEQATPTVEDEVSEREECLIALERLREGLAMLFPQERQVVELYYVRGMTLDEIAVEIRASADTAQRRHVAALSKLRGYLVDRGVTRAPRARDLPPWRSRSP